MDRAPENSAAVGRRERGAAGRFAERIAWLVLPLHAALLLAYLPRVGVTWDETKWFTLGRFLTDFVQGRIGRLLDPSNCFYYGSLPAFTCHFAHAIFNRRLGLMAPDDAYHMAGFGWAVLIVLGIFLWGRRIYGPGGAAAAVILWMLLPQLWPHSVANISDLPGAAGALWAAWAAWRISVRERALIRDWLLLGILMGAAYSLRAPNAYFLAAAVVAWAAASRLILRQRWPALKWWGPPLALVVFLLTVKALNPWLWRESVVQAVFWKNPVYYASGDVGGLRVWFNGRDWWAGAVPRYYFPLMWFWTTPLLGVALFALGAFLTLGDRRRLDPARSLWLTLWLFGFGKHLTGLGNYYGIRHALEIYAPQSLLAAGAVPWLWSKFRAGGGWRRWAAAAVLAAGLAEPAIVSARVFPYLTGYFNPLAGPLGRAWAANEPDYFGFSYLEGNRWVRSRIGRGAAVLAPIGGHLAQRNLYRDYNVDWRVQPGSLPESPPGTVLMLLNRRGEWLRYFGAGAAAGCPEGWEAIHEVKPAGELPPLLYICRKAAPGG
jgi:hypothetical protein